MMTHKKTLFDLNSQVYTSTSGVTGSHMSFSVNELTSTTFVADSNHVKWFCFLCGMFYSNSK